MTLVDVFNSGTLVCLITAAVKDGNQKIQSGGDYSGKTVDYRLDFITIDQSREAKTVELLKQRLKANTDGKFALLTAKRSEKDLKCIVTRPDLIKPYDFDRLEVSKISRDILNIAGVEGMSSAVLDTSKLMKGEKIDLVIFAPVESSRFISGDMATSLKLTGHDDQADSLEFGIVELTESGEYELVGKTYTHYGEVAMSKYDEYFITPRLAAKYGVALKDSTQASGTSAITTKTGSTSPQTVSAPAPNQERVSKPSVIKQFTATKPATATAALGLAAIGATAAAFFSKDKKTEVYNNDKGVIYYDRPGSNKDEVVIDGHGMTVEEYQQYLRMT